MLEAAVMVLQDFARARSVAFPSISTGVYGFPPDLAALVAFKMVLDFCAEFTSSLDEVRFVVFSEEDRERYAALFRVEFQTDADFVFMGSLSECVKHQEKLVAV